MIARGLWPTRAEAVAVAMSAVLFALAFPPFAWLAPAAFVCLVPLAVAIARLADGGGTLRGAVRLGFWFGLIAYGIAIYWIAIALSLFTKLAVLGFIGAILVMAACTTLFGAALFAARRATRLPLALLLPIVWVADEVFINYLPDLGFPWLPLGLATTHVPMLAQIADLSGVRGISFWIAATNGLLADAILLRARGRALAGRLVAVAAAAAAVAAYGAWRLASTPTRALAPIAVIQPNIPQEDKWQEENRDSIVGILTALTRAELARGRAQLVVWPEVALPGYLIEHPEWRDTLRALGRDGRTPILFGVLDVVFTDPRDPTAYEYYNAAMVTDTFGIVGGRVYRKGALVPVVERVPFVNPRWFKNLRYFGGYGRGTDPVVYELPFGKVAVLICYESIFPERSRAFRRRGTDVLVNITNDAWFGRSTAPWQHHAHLVLRAIENRVGIVRSANTGISGYIDPLGRVRDATPLFERAARAYMAETSDVRTPYLQVGDWVGLLSVIGTAVAVGLYVRERRRGRP